MNSLDRGHQNACLKDGIVRGDIVQIQGALTGGADPNVVFAGAPALRHAFFLTRDWSGMATLLLRAGADPNFAQPGFESVFSAVCSYGDNAQIQLMMRESRESQMKIDLCTPRTSDSSTPAFLMSCRMLSPETFQLMQELFERDGSVAVLAGDLPRHHLWTDVPHTDRRRPSAFMSSARHDNAPCFRWLLEHPDLNLVDCLENGDGNGQTVLWHAVEYSAIANVKMLLSRGANLLITDNAGLPLFQRAAQIAEINPGGRPILDEMKSFQAAKRAMRAIDGILGNRLSGLQK